MFAFIFTCGTRVTAIWGPWIGVLEHCDNAQMADLAYTISDLIMDIGIFCLPIPMVCFPVTASRVCSDGFKVWRLHMSTSKKLAVVLVFAVGALYAFLNSLKLHVLICFRAVVASILRVVFLSLLLHEILSES